MEAFLESHDTSDEDEDGEARPRLGSGLCGSGPTLLTGHRNTGASPKILMSGVKKAEV